MLYFQSAISCFVLILLVLAMVVTCLAQESCFLNLDCPANSLCCSNVCKRGRYCCESNNDCKSNELCVNYRCVTSKTVISGYCVNNTDCGTKERCYSNKCTPFCDLCTDDEHCEDGKCAKKKCSNSVGTIVFLVIMFGPFCVALVCVWCFCWHKCCCDRSSYPAVGVARYSSGSSCCSCVCRGWRAPSPGNRRQTKDTPHSISITINATETNAQTQTERDTPKQTVRHKTL